MSPDDIPEPVLRFILNHIDSVPHLETLLLVWEQPTRSWTATEVAERLYVSGDKAVALLMDLSRRGFISAGGQHHFRYDPHWDSGGALMQAVADSYRRHLVRMANLIHSKG